MALNATELKDEAEKFAEYADEALEFADDLPLPAAVKEFVEKADVFVKAVREFLDA